MLDPIRASSLRVEYEAHGLHETDLAADPFTQFGIWFDGAVEAGIEQPNAFVLATVSGDGRPSSRAVLMKSFDRRGLGFHTSMISRKSSELKANSAAAATFLWLPLHRQIRLEGVAEPISEVEAATYFATRPRGAQLSAHASMQSAVVSGRAEMEDRYRQVEAAFPDEVPVPEHWGGWRLVPDTVEFWQGRNNRFHDRLRYRNVDQKWVVERLSP